MAKLPNLLCSMVSLPLAVSLTALSAPQLLAQQQQPPGTKESPTKPADEASAVKAEKPVEKKPQSERMVITGSRLKRIDVENAIPTKVLGQEDFEKAGITSVAELLQNQTENTFGSFNGGGGYVSVGQASLDLHGLGSGRTLVLVNGRRLPVEASLGGTNINNIPMAMIERIEILKMSASAVYGADAVAGVVNVILKKAVSGSELAAKVNVSQEKGGNSLKASAVTGFQVLDGDVTLAVGAAQSERILTRDRKQLWTTVSPYNNNSAGAPAGTYSWGLLNADKPSSSSNQYVYRPSTNCPQENQIAFPNDPSNTLCRGDARKANNSDLMPQREERFVTLNFEKIIGKVETSTTLLASTVETAGSQFNLTLASNPSRTGAYAIPFGQAPDAIKAQASQLGLNYGDNDLIKIVGPSLFPEVKGGSSTRDTSLGLLTSFRGDFAKDWMWNFEASHFTSKRERDFENAPDRLAFTKSLFPVDPKASPELNIFKDDLAPIYGYFADLHGEEVNSVSSATAFVNGPVFPLEGGTAGLAAGVAVSNEKYILRADSKDTEFLNEFPETAGIYRARYLGSFGSDGAGQREISSAFTELDLPLIKALNVALTGRFDHYSDFGNTLNYGSSVAYAPFSSLKLRGNVGSGFKAPSLAEIYNRKEGGYLAITDTKFCDNSVPAENPCGQNGSSYSVYVNSPGNRDLHEETSLSYNFGLVLEPIDFFNVSVDYWNAKIRDVIGQEQLDQQVEKEIKGESTGATTIERGADGRISSIQNPYSNLGALRSQGIDVSSNFNFQYDQYAYGLATTYSRMISRKNKPTSTDPEEEQVGSYGAPRYRMVNSTFVRRAGHNLRFDVTTVGRQESSRFTEDPSFGYISPEHRYDVSYAWNYSKSGTLNFGVFNLENRILSLHTVDKETKSSDFNRAVADVRGRQLQIGVRQSF